jgi:putative ABC transport system permease protein
MSYVRAVFARIAGMFSNRDASDLRDELQAHLEMETAENIRRGMSPDEARRQALIASGGLASAAEAVRDQRGLPWLETIAADIKYALRALRHSPAFTIVVVITLALGIGANTAIFSVIRGVLLKPLPHRDGDRLVYLRHSTDKPGGSNINFSVPEVRDFRTGAPSLAGIAEYSPTSLVLQGDNDVTRMSLGLVTGNFFDVMGLSPVLGRVTRATDDGPGVPAVMVLTHAFWTHHFGADSAIVGRQVKFDETSVTIIGVLQPAPYFPDRVDAFTNMVVSPHHVSAMMIQTRPHRMTEVLARLAPGASLAQARSEVAAVNLRVMRDFKEAYNPNSHYTVTVVPFKEAIGEPARVTLTLLMIAAAFVLIICAANVTNLTLMRRVRREHELVVRAALGAGAGRLRRLLLVENLVLTSTGGAVAVPVAIGGVSLLISFAERVSPRANEIGVDGAVLAFTFALSIGLALLLSFAASLPKHQTLASSVAAGTPRLTGGVRKQRMQRALVVAQIAVSVVLLAGAGLLTRSIVRLINIGTGLKTEQVLTLPVAAMNLSRIDPAHLAAADLANKELYERIRAELQALPGVTAVGIGSSIPLRVSPFDFDVDAEGNAHALGDAIPHAEMRTASPAYFRASGIPLISGREFLESDGDGAAKVVIINQTLVDKLYPGVNPLGKRIAFADPHMPSPYGTELRTIVGVVGNTRDGGLDAKPRAVVFAPFAQEIAMQGAFAIRADSNVASLASAATRIVRRLVPNIPVEHVLTVTQIKEESLAPRRLNAELVSLLGVLALIITAVGITGVLAFSVSTRTNEIGIRMSLGADRRQVQSMVLKEGGMLLALGLGLGLVATFFATGLLRGLLFDVAPHDPVTFVGVGVMMAVIGLVACWIPARRASRVDPVAAMRG